MTYEIEFLSQIRKVNAFLIDFRSAENKKKVANETVQKMICDFGKLKGGEVELNLKKQRERERKEKRARQRKEK